ncbi:MAG: hypothetical protein AUF76_09160 [Acidobacteria bacterium 13_1_20CM_2_65_9]|nr:MAG: hypothetical protein AUF76_09160 [Acidobacteria bacterium 13_1_20CM_2_65_9]
MSGSFSGSPEPAADNVTAAGEPGTPSIAGGSALAFAIGGRFSDETVANDRACHRRTWRAQRLSYPDVTLRIVQLGGLQYFEIGAQTACNDDRAVN